VFPVAARSFNSNNYPAGTIFNSLTFSGFNYNVSGATIGLNAGATNVGGANFVGIPLLLLNAQTFRADAYWEIRKTIDNGGNTLNVTGIGEVQFVEAISGAGGITKSGSGLAALAGSNSYGGLTQVLDGRVTVLQSSALGLASAGTIVSAGARLTVGSGVTIPEPLDLGGTLSSEEFVNATNTWAGPITLVSNQARVEVAGTPMVINGVISGTGALTKSISGVLRLTADNIYTGRTTNLGGTLVVNGSQPASDIFLYGGTIGGTGVVSSITSLGFNDPKISPGDDGPGRLTTSNIVLNFSTGFDVELNGTSPGTNYDQLRVFGTVNLANAILNPILGFAPGVSNSFTIIDNDGVDAVVGTFAGLPEGAMFGVNGTPFRITYVGGSGNDVVITHLSDIGFESITRLGNGNIQLQATGGVSGVGYSILSSSNLDVPIAWNTIGTSVANANGIFSFTDTNIPIAMRFYRAQLP
jgi:autotransporter-associated beta strand protein